MGWGGDSVDSLPPAVITLNFCKAKRYWCKDCCQCSADYLICSPSLFPQTTALCFLVAYTTAELPDLTRMTHIISWDMRRRTWCTRRFCGNWVCPALWRERCVYTGGNLQGGKPLSVSIKKNITRKIESSCSPQRISLDPSAYLLTCHVLQPWYSLVGLFQLTDNSLHWWSKN